MEIGDIEETIEAFFHPFIGGDLAAGRAETAFATMGYTEIVAAVRTDIGMIPYGFCSAVKQFLDIFQNSRFHQLGEFENKPVPIIVVLKDELDFMWAGKKFQKVDYKVWFLSYSITFDRLFNKEAEVEGNSCIFV
ncbi:MAG: hypothetical protein V1789_06570 [PVC group bacterium]